MTKRDYYEILSVAKNANQDEIKKAYRKMAIKYHPDKNPDNPEAEEKFKEATEAYEILRDPQKRAAYDRFGHAGVKGGAHAPGGFGFDFSDALEIFMRDFGGFGDIFGGMAGARARGGTRARRGPDMRAHIPLTLEEVATGAKKTLKVRVNDVCDTCSGSGSTRVSATAVMKFVSPSQRGRQWTWRWSGTPAPAPAPRLRPTFTPSGR